jgi:cell division protein FtsX
VGSIAGFVVFLSMLGWFIGSTVRGRRLRRFPPPPAVLDQA